MLRKYQEIPVQMAIDYFRQPTDTSAPALIVLPTAWGKSWLAAYVARSIPDGESLLVLQPTKELLKQNYEKYVSLCGNIADAAVYSASMRKKDIGKITYATIGSIKKLGHTFKEYGFTKMLVDEAHLYPRKEESMIGQFLQDSGIRQVLGITATPIKMETVSSTKLVVQTDESGRPLLDSNGHPITKRTFDGYSKQVILTNPSMDGEFYKEILYVGQIREMVDGGHWASLRYDRQPYDGKKLKLNAAGSDFTEKSIVDAYTFNNVHERIKGALNYYTNRKHCIVFVPSVEEAQLLAEEVPDAAFVSGKTPQKQRDMIIDGFKQGDIRVVFNVGILSTGFDYPQIDLIVLAFSTASISKYYQAIGRGVRISPEKSDCQIVDMCGNLERFGKIENLVYRKDEIWRLIGNEGDILTGIPVNAIGYYNIRDYARIKNGTCMDSVMPFGKYKGISIDEVPSTYLQWMLARIYDDPERERIADAIRYKLENEIRDTTEDVPMERMPTGLHQGELIQDCPRSYLEWFYANTPWNQYNDSLKRGIENVMSFGPGRLFQE